MSKQVSPPSDLNVARKKEKAKHNDRVISIEAVLPPPCEMKKVKCLLNVSGKFDLSIEEAVLLQFKLFLVGGLKLWLYFLSATDR